MTYLPPTSPASATAVQAVALAIFGALALPAALASAQTHTPVSPLDTTPAGPPPAGSGTIVAPTANPTAPPTTRSSGSELVDALPVGPVAGAEPLELPELLPEGVSAAAGLTPEAAIARAREVSLDTRIAGARREAADAAVQGARRAYVPRASVTARYTRLSSYTPGTIQSFDTPGCLSNIADCQTNPGNYLNDVVLQQPILNQYALTTSVSVPLSDYVGATRRELQAAQLEREAAVAAERGASSDSVLVTLETYFEVVRARAQLGVADDAVAAAEQRTSDTRAQVESGLVTASALLEAEASAQSFVRLQTVARSRVVVAERALRDLLELPDEEPIVLSVELAALPAGDAREPEELRTEAQANDPYVTASTLRAEAQAVRADAERARMFPSLSVTLNHTYANPNSRIFPQTTQFRGTWDISAQLTFSLDGSLLAGARRNQRLALALESSLTAENDARRAGRAAIEAQGLLVASLAEVDARRLAATSAAQRERDAAARTRAGLGTRREVLDASVASLRARLDLVDAVVDAHIANARLVRALGADGTP
ncbi:MAG: TolC family protein [Polyangiales bacterium]|nr:TolC family protein [Myxococcales bacterium]MCB9657459.1 TolC family protein [Sandaracinaceae bacterium]